MQNTLPVRVPELFIPSCDRSVWFKPGGEGEEKQQVIMEQTRHLNWMVSYCTRVSTAPTDFCAQQFFILGCEVANINIKSHHSITKQELYLKKKKSKMPVISQEQRIKPALLFQNIPAALETSSLSTLWGLKKWMKATTKCRTINLKYKVCIFNVYVKTIVFMIYIICHPRGVVFLGFNGSCFLASTADFTTPPGLQEL